MTLVWILPGSFYAFPNNTMWSEILFENIGPYLWTIRKSVSLSQLILRLPSDRLLRWGTNWFKASLSMHKKDKHCSILGSFPCGHCSFCQYIRHEKTFSLPIGTTFKPAHITNCQTWGVVYLMSCECGAYYVGKTKQEIHRRISKHVYHMQIGNHYLPLGRHVVEVHNYKMPKVSFTALNRIHIPERGGDWNKILLQHEQRWIFKLNFTSFPGLNDAISFSPFLKGFVSGKTQ